MTIDAGLQVNNINNFIQIDSTFTNAVLRKSGETTVGYINNISFMDFEAELPLFFFRNESNAYVGSRIMKTSENNYRVYFNIDGYAGIPTIQYYIFDLVPPTLQKSNFGLQVFDEQGKPVFDSNAYYCNFVDSYTFPDFSVEKYGFWVGGYGPREIFSHVVSDARSNKLAIMPSYAVIGQHDSEFGYMIYAPGYKSSRMAIEMTCNLNGFEETGSIGFSSYGAEKNNILVAEVGSLPVPYDYKP